MAASFQRPPSLFTASSPRVQHSPRTPSTGTAQLPMPELQLPSFARIALADFEAGSSRYPSVLPSPDPTAHATLDPLAKGDPTDGLARSGPFNPNANPATNTTNVNDPYTQSLRSNSRPPRAQSDDASQLAPMPSFSTTSQRNPDDRSLNGGAPESSSRASADAKATLPSNALPIERSTAPIMIPGNPRHPQLPGRNNSTQTRQQSPIVPMSSSPQAPFQPSSFPSPYPMYPTPRRSVQPAPMPTKPPVPPEEVCIECMMRDKDLEDVDVTGPGVWDRESDVHYHELVRQEEGERRGKSNLSHSSHSSGRPSARGRHRLTEENLKLWLTMNPREPTARWQTLEAYIKSQAAFLEAEALARAQAQRESRALESRMRDTYTQLRRSAYDLGVNDALGDDTHGGVRVQAPRSPSGGWADLAREERARRDVTLLESGMIMERVDVRKEEREERERRKREERKMRKSATSGDISLYAQSGGMSEYTESPSAATGYLPPSTTSVPTSGRPLSTVMTPPSSRPSLLSQRSFDGKNEKARFLGFRHFGGPSAPSLISGSLMDMHLGLDQDHAPQSPQMMSFGSQTHAHPPPFGSRSPGPNRGRPRTADDSKLMATIPRTTSPSPKSKKSKKGIGKLWKLVTGKHEHKQPEQEELPRSEDDLSLPLAPPPPLSLLVDRGGSDRANPHMRQVSTPSLPISSSPGHPRSISVPTPGVSPPTAPSSLLPSPTSNRFPWRDSTGDEKRLKNEHEVETGPPNGLDDSADGFRSLHLISEPDLSKRQHLQVPIQGTPSSPVSTNTVVPSGTPRPMSLHKSLPPLPPGEAPPPRAVTSMSMYALTQSPSGELGLPNPAFRGEVRRQSFSGIPGQPIAQPYPLAQTLQPNRGDFQPPEAVGKRYDEFGASRRSLGNAIGEATTKRRSRFGLFSLLGKKSPAKAPPVNDANIRSSVAQYQTYDLNRSPTSMSDALPLDRPTSALSHPNLLHHGKRIDDLVERDLDFLAYRYPSNDVRLDLRR